MVSYRFANCSADMLLILSASANGPPGVSLSSRNTTILTITNVPRATDTFTNREINLCIKPFTSTLKYMCGSVMLGNYGFFFDYLGVIVIQQPFKIGINHPVVF